MYNGHEHIKELKQSMKNFLLIFPLEKNPRDMISRDNSRSINNLCYTIAPHPSKTSINCRISNSFN